MMDTTFYTLAHAALDAECKRLCDFTDALDQKPSEKKQRLAEYKCAKYRYASVSLIHSTIWNNNLCRTQHNLAYSHHLLLPFDEIFKEQAEHVAVYDSLPAEEQPDYSLYHAMMAFTAREIDKLESRMPDANDWEKVELEERLGGLRFAKACLDEAWQKRGEVRE